MSDPNYESKLPYDSTKLLVLGSNGPPLVSAQRAHYPARGISMSHSKSLIPFSTISLITQSRSAPWRLAKQFFNAGRTFGRPAVPVQFLPTCASEAWASSFMFIWFGFGITGMSYRWWAPIVGSRGRDWSSLSGIGVGSGDGWRSDIGVKPENKRVVASGLRRKK